MRKNVAAVALCLAFAFNIGSGVTRKVDHMLLKIESSLSEKLDDRACAEQALEVRRKGKSRPAVCGKA